MFCEPGGLCVSEEGDKLFIADTNNHSVKVVDLTNNLVTRLNFGLETSAKKETEVPPDQEFTVHHSIPSGGRVTIRAALPRGGAKAILNREAPSSWKLEVVPGEGWTSVPSGKLDTSLDMMNWVVEYPEEKLTTDQEVQIRLTFSLFLCSKKDNVCFTRTVRHVLNLRGDGVNSGEGVYIDIDNLWTD